MTRLDLRRVLAVAVTVLLGGALAVSPASAQTPGPGGAAATPASVRGVLRGSSAAGSVVLAGSGPVRTSLKHVVLGRTVLRTYCIEFTVLARPGAAYREVPWAPRPGAQGARMAAMLQQSYPAVPLSRLAARVGGRVTAAEAVAATQAAVWHVSDGRRLADTPANSLSVRRLYRFLVAGGRAAAPPGVAPAAGDGVAGERLGPFAVTGGTAPLSVAVRGPAGVRALDSSGRSVSQVLPGRAIWVGVPRDTPAGRATLTVTGAVASAAGRLFASRGSQTLALATLRTTRATAAASLSWRAAPRPVPSARAVFDCAAGGLQVTLVNTGDAPERFDMPADVVVDVPPHAQRTVLVPVEEDADYSVTVRTAGGFARTFTGRRDCRAASPVASPVASPAPTASQAVAPPAPPPTAPPTPTRSARAPRPAPPPAARAAPMLPRTGARTRLPLIAGLALVALGALLLLAVPAGRGGHARR